VFRYLLETDAPQTRPLWSFVVSTVVNVGLIAASVAATDRTPGEPLLPESQTRVQYFLPPLPAREHIEVTGVHWATGLAPGAGDLPVTGKGLLVAGSRELGLDDGRKGSSEIPVVADSGGPSYGVGGPVYMESELDHPVERDPESAGPAYPKELQAKGIEGYVAAEFVVDTTGRADESSLRIMDATHPEFEKAVRAALPGMRFRPAELGKERVRQLVAQSFKFVMPVTETAAKKP
jgi:protein TonB